MKLLEMYLENSGRMLVLINPGVPDCFVEILADWGIRIEDGTIIDPVSHVAPHKDTLLVSKTKNRFGFEQTYFPGCTAIIPQEKTEENVEIVALLWSSPESWLEKEYTPGSEPRYDEQIDAEGPLAIGVMVSAGKKGKTVQSGSRIVVIGDSDFAANRHFRNGNNSDLFLTAINWLSEGEEIISVDRKVLPNRQLILSPEEARFLHISSIGILPLILLGIGAVFWYRRR
jgi:ABC-type uncharacterized transport system involved in gliding motility auxiliary subunit